MKAPRHHAPSVPLFRHGALAALVMCSALFTGCGSESAATERASAANEDPKPVASTDGGETAAVPSGVLASIANEPARDMPRASAPTPPASMGGLPDQMDHPVVTVNASMKPASIAIRSQRRAYLGAPPVIPHLVADQTTSSDCMTCHEDGLKSGQLVVPPLPHPYMTNCMQCHVEASSDFGSPSFLAENSFDGLTIPMGGTRAWDGAPPTIPHPMWMRENCLSCHGSTARPGLETTHPWRQSCTQCHVPAVGALPGSE